MLILFAVLAITVLAIVGPAIGDDSPATNAAEPPAPFNPPEFLNTYCADCHQGDESEAGFDLDQLSLEQLARKQWRTALDRVHNHDMPPRDADLPTEQQRQQFTEWLRTSLRQQACSQGIQPGPALSRRLNRDEYAHTIRDLLGIHVNVALTLPADGAGGEGFDNAASTLSISPLHAEKYLEAARAAVDHTFKEQRALRRILIAQPDDNTTAQDAARRVLKRFLRRAFRRPATKSELDDYLAFFAEQYAGEGSYHGAIRTTLTAVLVSPHFLFRVERPAAGTTAEPLDDFELASRLSYFLWTSMPDKQLLAAAESGQLRTDQGLAEQVKRMLGGDNIGRASNKVGGFARSFTEQWLGTRALGREFKPDPKVAPRYDSELEGGMRYETALFFEEILVKDLSVLNFLDADFTYVNRSLARHYGIKGEFREQPRRVELTAEHRRGGLLGMAGVLAVSSYPHRTSPVLRGKWVLETLLGTPPAPPPPDVPELDEEVDFQRPQTFREKLEHHRENPTCAACHDRMDPLGFGLENYDVLGKWRRIQNGKLINARGQLPDGSEFNGPAELKRVLMKRKDQFTAHLTAKLLGFALNRQLADSDYCVVDQIAARVIQSDYSAHTLILGIVQSVPFRQRAGLPTVPPPTDADAAAQPAPTAAE